MSSPDIRSITNVIDPLLAERLDYVPSSTRDSLAEAIASRVRVLLATSHDTREAERRHVKNPYSEHCLWDSEPWPCNVRALLDQPASKPDDAGGIDVDVLERAYVRVLDRTPWAEVRFSAQGGIEVQRRMFLERIAAEYAGLTTNPEDQG